MRSWHRYVTRAAAKKAAEEASEQARQRTARHLLATRIATLLATRPVEPAPFDNDWEPHPYAAGAARARAALRVGRAA
ncbi:hypothetical protein [Streptomyces sp. V1I1]|uniref:hypothetical protein n=1 Tax=Streptomyces sp. V1I1 TaxID=3042272 RepID=UPI00278A3837|nr:hypothetical protein [Streptomyces sp. V1I1]MDQ0945871.1 hypothetical protein [Streptomyces sp. V1I1]